MRHVAALAASAARPIIFREAAYFAVLACARVSIRARRPSLDKEGLCDGARFVVVLNAQPTRDAAVCVLLSHRRREARTRAYGGARVCQARSQRTASLPREACQTYLRDDDLALLLPARALDASAAMKVLLGIVAQCVGTSA